MKKTSANQAPDAAIEETHNYLLQDSRGYLDKYLMFWKEGGGYTSDVNKAERFTLDAATRQMKSRGTDIPWKLAHLEHVSRPTVDMQLLRNLKSDFGKEIVFQVPNVYSGNAIHFLKADGGHSPDLTQAAVFGSQDPLSSLPSAEQGLVARDLATMHGLAFKTVNKHSVRREHCLAVAKRETKGPGF